MKNSKIAPLVIMSSLSILVFAGCSYMKSLSTNKNTDNNNNNNTDSQIPNSTVEIKKNVLNDLVNENKISQIQSDKVIAALTKSMPQDMEATNANMTNTNNEAGIINDKMPNKNKLYGLVTSGVITQAQSNTINQKIQIAINKVK